MYGIAKKLRDVLPFSVYVKISKFSNFVFFIFNLINLSLTKRKVKFNSNSNTIISLTSWNERIDYVWITIETLFRQNVEVKAIVLVLSQAEFPHREIPSKLKKICKRGLTIEWVEDNIKSYKKLNPIIENYPDCNIITFDDDVIYDKNIVSRLQRAAKDNPECIIGARGHKIKVVDKKAQPYKQWTPIRSYSRGNGILLTGVGGIFYPAGIFDIKLLTNKSLYQKVAPTADDIWFWAMAVYSRRDIVCLGEHGPRESTPFLKAERLTSINVQGGANDVQFSNVVNCFEISLSDLTVIEYT